MAATGAELIPGFDLVSAWLDIETRLSAADIVVTGEGRFDDSSLNGKGPGAVAGKKQGGIAGVNQQVVVAIAVGVATRAHFTQIPEPAGLAEVAHEPGDAPVDQA